MAVQLCQSADDAERRSHAAHASTSSGRGATQSDHTQNHSAAPGKGYSTHSGGWWQLEVVLAVLSQCAAAGTRPELFKLMAVRTCELSAWR